MTPSACLSPVVTLALLLLITGFALGGHHTLSKKRHHRHTMIARFLPLANDSAAFSPQSHGYRTHHRQGHNISARWSAKCPAAHMNAKKIYTVIVWTTYAAQASTDGNVRTKLIGDVCQTSWHDLDHAWPYDDFESGSRDGYSFWDSDIGSQITELYIYLSTHNLFGVTNWHLNKIDTYYKNVKRPFYWNNWVPVDREHKLMKTGNNAFAVTASMTTVMVFVMTTWFLV